MPLGRLPETNADLRLVGKPSQGWQGLMFGSALVDEKLLPAFAAVLQGHMPAIAAANQLYTGTRWYNLHTNWCTTAHPPYQQCEGMLLHDDPVEFWLTVEKGLDQDPAYLQIKPLPHWDEGLQPVEGSLILGYPALATVADILPDVIRMLTDHQAQPGEQLSSGAHVLTSAEGRTWICSCDSWFTAITERHRLQTHLAAHAAEAYEIEARSRGTATEPTWECGCPTGRVPQHHSHELTLQQRVSDPFAGPAWIVLRAYWTGSSTTVYKWPYTPAGADAAREICSKFDRQVEWTRRGDGSGGDQVRFDELRRNTTSWPGGHGG